MVQLNLIKNFIKFTPQPALDDCLEKNNLVKLGLVIKGSTECVSSSKLTISSHKTTVQYYQEKCQSCRKSSISINSIKETAKCSTLENESTHD